MSSGEPSATERPERVSSSDRQERATSSSRTTHARRTSETASRTFYSRDAEESYLRALDERLERVKRENKAHTDAQMRAMSKEIMKHVESRLDSPNKRMEAIEEALLVVQAEQKKELQQQLEEGVKSIQELITLTLKEKQDPRGQRSLLTTPKSN